ncbi:MAG TPA: TraR/DksA family transcriptional regulator [Spongiibacteraceae bacterium]|nr:TraR/DksA family transcriptional regulator [Spongiibacteraceae bacterium]
MNTGNIREQLVRRRDEIMAIVNKVGKHIGHREEPLDRDSSERALELENLDALFAIDRETRIELRQINDAIERIDIGQYGFCSECGAPIDTERLAALPYADTCIICARRSEAKQLNS